MVSTDEDFLVFNGIHLCRNSVQNWFDTLPLNKRSKMIYEITQVCFARAKADNEAEERELGK